MIEQLNTLSLIWWNWMAGMFWQVSLLIILISGIDLLVRRWVWPQVRYALWFMILLKLVLPPTIASPVSITSNLQPIALKALGHYHTEETSLKTYKIPSSEASTTSAEGKTPITTKYKAISTESKDVLPETKENLNWQVFAMIFWLLGSFAILVFLIKKFSEMRKVNRSGEKKAVPDWFELILIRCARRLNLQIIPNVVITKKVNSPAIFGMIRPVLLLPTDFFHETSKRDAENILLHELAHIKRRDLLVKELETFLTIIYWFNPLFWGAKKQLQHLRELCCDSTVANILQKKVKGYRNTLLETARRLLAQPLEPGLGFLGLFEDSGKISTRLKWLEKDTFKFRWLRNISVAFILIFVPLCILPMTKSELQKTMEDIAEIEEDLSEEMDKIGKLLAELDLLKEKLNDFHKEIEKINGKEIDSLEKILEERDTELDKKTEEHLEILKENEKRIRDWNEKIKKWEDDYKEKNKEMLKKYGNIDKEYIEKIKEFQRKYEDKYKNKKWDKEKLNKSIDSIFKNLDESTLESFKDLFPIPEAYIKFDTFEFPFDSFALMKIGEDHIFLPVDPSISNSAICIEPSKSKDTCSNPITKVHNKENYQKCSPYKEYFFGVYDIEKEGRIQVHNHNGKVEVSKWNKNKVEIHATKNTKKPIRKSETHFVEVKIGPTMTIHTKKEKDASVDFSIKVPQGARVEKITTSNGKIVVAGIKGPTYLNSSNGMIVAKNIDGDITAQTSNSKIDIDNAGFVKASTSNGPISLRNIEGIADIETSNGKIYAEINELKSDYTKIGTSNGEIELHLSKKLDAELTANTSEGKIYTHEISEQQRFEIINIKEEKHIKAKLGNGGHKQIVVKTSNGNIHIKAL